MLNEVTTFEFRNKDYWGANNYFYCCSYNNKEYRGMVHQGKGGNVMTLNVIHCGSNKTYGRTHKVGMAVHKAMADYAKKVLGEV